MTSNKYAIVEKITALRIKHNIGRQLFEMVTDECIAIHKKATPKRFPLKHHGFLLILPVFTTEFIS